MQELELEFENMNIRIKVTKNDMNPVKLADLKRGFFEEGRMKSIIEKWHKTIVNKCEDNFVFDYYNDVAFYEIKSRNCTFDRYPTTMVGKNKIDFANTLPDRKFYFIFCFKDGDYIYEYDKNNKLYFELGGRCDRGRDEYKQYCYIPIRYLEKITSVVS